MDCVTKAILNFVAQSFDYLKFFSEIFDSTHSMHSQVQSSLKIPNNQSLVYSFWIHHIGTTPFSQIF